MGKWRVGSSWAIFVLAVGMVGCGNSTKDRCKTLCEWLNSCAGEKVDCSSSQMDQCADNYDSLTNSCQGAFDDFADCLDDQDNKCDDVVNHCKDEATAVSNKCE